MLNDQKTPFSGKVAIASNDQKRVTGHIGRCRSFVVYEIDGNKIVNREVRENLFTNHRMMHQNNQHHGEGEGRHSHVHLINGLKDCSYLISSGGGWRVVEDLKQHNITPLFAEVELIEDAINMFIRGDLKNNSELTCNHSEN
jgi:predicted Fe-Mo cluster-binding NifX family protein